MSSPSVYSHTLADKVEHLLHSHGVRRPTDVQIHRIIQTLTIPLNLIDDVLDEVKSRFF